MDIFLRCQQVLEQKLEFAAAAGHDLESVAGRQSGVVARKHPGERSVFFPDAAQVGIGIEEGFELRGRLGLDKGVGAAVPEIEDIMGPPVDSDKYVEDKSYEREHRYDQKPRHLPATVSVV